MQNEKSRYFTYLKNAFSYISKCTVFNYTLQVKKSHIYFQLGNRIKVKRGKNNNISNELEKSKNPYVALVCR